MLPKKNRAGVRELGEVFTRGRFLNSSNLTFKFIRSGDSLPRISFIVPKTIAKKATERNYLRRIGYKALTKYIEEFPKGILGAFVFKTYQKEVPVLQKEIETVLRKLPKEVLPLR